MSQKEQNDFLINFQETYEALNMPYTKGKMTQKDNNLQTFQQIVTEANNLVIQLK